MRLSDDEASALWSVVTTCIQRFPGAVWPIRALIGVAVEMAARLDHDQRICIAEVLRSAADVVEQRTVERVTQ